MRYASIVLLSSTAAALVALGGCSSDDTAPANPTTSTTTTSGSTTSSSATGGAGGVASTTATTSTTSTGGSGGAGGSPGTAGSSGSAGSGGSGGGSGGSAGGGAPDSGTDAGSAGGTGDASRGDGEASAKAVATVMPLTGGTITGTATFTASGSDVTVVVALANCPEGIHPMHIHAGTSCASEQEQGTHWDPPRGENIGSGTGQIMCMADGTAMLTYTRLGTDPKPWTIGGPTASDVIGHPFIVHAVGAAATARHGCGVITRQ